MHIGEYTSIAQGAQIADDAVIGNNVTIYPDVIIGAGCTIADCAVLGKKPKLAASSTADTSGLTPLKLGDRCSVGAHTVLMAGTTFGDGCVVGDNAGVREKCTIGDDVVIGRSVTVENGTSIGSRTRIQSGAYITAYVTIEEDVFIAPMVVTTNDNLMGRTEDALSDMKGCTIHRGARVGGGAHILPNIDIGQDSFIATGSIVTKDVAPYTLVMGAPARAVREVADRERLEMQR
ncbi:MAG: acetyltransferase [Actinomycetia bacterium]|nr:acetyltransferase [Actinomycetes bacterium]